MSRPISKPPENECQKTLSPPVLTLETLADADPAVRLAVIGDPVGHSLSPQLHQPALDAAGRAIRYERLQVPVGQVAEALRRCAAQGFLGLNVTVPHKLEALAACARVSEHARLLGAVNTITFTADGPQGANTDGPGLLEALKEVFGLDHLGLREQSILLLGAGGGAGRAIAVQLALSAPRALHLANRTEAKSATLAAELRQLPEASSTLIRSLSLDPAALHRAAADTTLILNATSLGLHTNDPLPLPAAALRPQHLVMDLVYRRGGTPLLAAAQSVGARAADGLPLLLHQGILSQQHWFGELPDAAAMRASLMAATSAR